MPFRAMARTPGGSAAGCSTNSGSSSIATQPGAWAVMANRPRVCPPSLPSAWRATTKGFPVTSALIWHQIALRAAPPSPSHSLTVRPVRLGHAQAVIHGKGAAFHHRPQHIAARGFIGKAKEHPARIRIPQRACAHRPYRAGRSARAPRAGSLAASALIWS